MPWPSGAETGCRRPNVPTLRRSAATPRDLDYPESALTSRLRLSCHSCWMMRRAISGTKTRMPCERREPALESYWRGQTTWHRSPCCDDRPIAFTKGTARSDTARRNLSGARRNDGPPEIAAVVEEAGRLPSCKADAREPPHYSAGQRTPQACQALGRVLAACQENTRVPPRPEGRTKSTKSVFGAHWGGRVNFYRRASA